MKRMIFLKLMMGAFISFCILLSCEREGNVKFPAYRSQLVLHGYVETNSLFRVAVGKTIGYGQTAVPDSATFISNAIVLLYENGLFKDTLRYRAADKRYVAATAMPSAGNTYTVTVKAEGFDPIEAEAVAPFTVPNNSVQHIRNARFDATGTSLDDVVFSFNDPAGVENYYVAEINRAQPTTNPSVNPFISFCVRTYDPVVELYQDNLNPFESGACINNIEVLFNDKTFNGAAKQITLSGDSWSLQTFSFNNVTYRPFFKKYNVSAAFYNYIKAGISLRSLDDNPFAQMPLIRGNVKNGHGLFTIYSMTVDTLR
ncbi:MAG: DUF4249 domain-containing protein [Chitinophagaceae bacterium]